MKASAPAVAHVASAFALVLCAPLVAAACDNAVGEFVSITGTVEVQSHATGTWGAAALDTPLCEGDTIRAATRSRAAVALINDAVLRVDQETTIRLLNVAGEAQERSLLELLEGALQSFSRKPRQQSINTPYLNGSIEGTEFVVRVDAGHSEFTVFEGTVIAANAQGEVALGAGESARAAAGEAPQRYTVVKPRGLVEWALYYPPVLSAASAAAANPALADAAQRAAAGDTAGGFAALAAVPVAARDASYHALEASLLLAAGRVEPARAALDTSLAQAPEQGEALALRAVIAVAQNDLAAARADAERAVALAPQSSAAALALSYVLQAELDLAGARAVLEQAVVAQPGDALAWARLAELRLALGARREALAAAAEAVRLAPGTSRAQTVRGYAELGLLHGAAAEAAFDTAIAADSADPLPHLGRGLARVHQGRLADGRRDIEAAVALDGNSALLRAYLGKAYFEEKRSPLDEQQFVLAEGLDPNDPTAYLYDGIRLQTAGQPVRAFRAISDSIARNGNRAVYRSRLLLDGDRAARGTSLARVYKDLGFNPLGQNAATRSMSLDPTNASAHRFLSDTYRDGTERVEIARVSELLQAQLLQDVNTNPVQPSLSSTNLNIVTSGGPAEPGFNEFTSLFERNQLQANVSGYGGTNDTHGVEAVVSGRHDGLSGSAGGFDYDTDGFRDNNDLDHEIWDVYGQWAITPELNVQGEYLTRETSHGDLRQNFDLDSFDPTYRRELDSDVWRAGARYSPDQRQDFLFSYIHSEVDSGGGAVPVDIPGVIRVTEDQSQEDDGDQFEGQYVFRAERYNVVAGAAHADSSIGGELTATALVTIPPPLPFLPPITIEDVQVFPLDSQIDDTRGYAYANVDLLPTVTATLGLSYQYYDETLVSDGIDNDFDAWNPKVGVHWDVTPTLAARAAYFEVVKPVLVSNRTLEPTQVAGFNQFYDDPDGTRSRRYGGGLDWRPLSDLHLGGEFTLRDVESPVIDFTAGAVRYEDRDEQDHRGYLFWTPHPRWALGAEGRYDRFENEDASLIANTVPDEVETWTVPLRATYFDPLGWFAGVVVTYVNQEVTRDPTQSTLAQGDSDFALVDLAVGYRFPGRYGMASITVHNVLDENFDYQDNSYRTFTDQPYIGPYVPQAVLMGRLTVSF